MFGFFAVFDNAVSVELFEIAAYVVAAWKVLFLRAAEAWLFSKVLATDVNII